MKKKKVAGRHLYKASRLVTSYPRCLGLGYSQAWRVSLVRLCGLSRYAPELGPQPLLLREPLSGRSAALRSKVSDSRRWTDFRSFMATPLDG